MAATFQKDVLIFVTLKYSVSPYTPLLGIKPRAFHMLRKSSTTGLPEPLICRDRVLLCGLDSLELAIKDTAVKFIILL